MAIFANKHNVPLRAIFVNSPILCMCIYTPRANITSVVGVHKLVFFYYCVHREREREREREEERV